jgi:hypothetical protein
MANGTFTGTYSNDDTGEYSSFGIGVGVKRAVTKKPVLTAIFLLLNE